MKAKQLEYLTGKHEQYQTHGLTKKPDTCNCEIKVALMSPNPPKFKPLAEIIDTIKHKAACERCFDSVALADIFKAPKSKELIEWEASEKDRLQRVAKYNAIAAPIMARAALDEDADAVEISEQLRQAAVTWGLF